MNLRTSLDVKQAVLQKAGEQLDGTSPFDDRVLEYVNDAYQASISGGSEWGTDIDEPWIWAQRKEPIILVLEPPYEAGTVTLTAGSEEGTFSVAPTTSLSGYFLRIESRSEIFRITSHTAGDTAFEIDSEYTDESGSFVFKAIPLDYEVEDNRIVVTARNQKVDFDEGAGELSFTIAEGSYSASEFAADLETGLNTAGNETYTVTYDSVLRQFIFTTTGGNFTFLFVTGTNALKSIQPLVGYDVLDVNVVNEPMSTYPLNAIQRLVAPATVYRDRNAFAQSAKDQGKIYGLSLEAFEEHHPLTMLNEGIPDRFTIVEERASGSLRIRFNKYVEKRTRVELRYIPIPFDLQDNAVSVPLVPRAFRPFLVYAATQLLMQDKSDSRAQEQLQLAQQKLKAMQNDNRTEIKHVSKDLGRIIPRKDTMRVRRTLLR